jgi:hypothetical protein
MPSNLEQDEFKNLNSNRKLVMSRSGYGLVQVAYQLLGTGKEGKINFKKVVLPGVRDEGKDGNCRGPELRHHTYEEVLGNPVFLVPGDVYVAKNSSFLECTLTLFFSVCLSFVGHLYDNTPRI